MLKALELVGFKSFADKTRFEFPPGITTVVGPNGSGKSNIVDAIKWVLGEQSVKSLRGREMADVIFNGSDTRRGLNTAEVTLTLDNSKGLLPIDTPEVHVTRRVYRSGEGEYLINRQPSRLRDIRDLFAGTGATTEAYSVIEQGKVDVLLQASARDRRVIFEEAAGISRFKAKKLEATRRLERVEQNLLRLSDVVEEVEGRLRSVRTQANKARRYREYANRLQELRTQVGLADWTRLSEELAAVEGQLAALTDERDAVTAKAEALEAQVLEADGRIGEINEAIRECEGRIAANRERIAARESTIDHQRARCRDLEEQIARHRLQVAAMTTRASDVEQQLHDTYQAVCAAEEEHREIALDLGEQERGLTELIAQLDQVRAEAETRRAVHVDQMRTAAGLGNEITRLESETAAATAIQNRCRQRLVELDGQLGQIVAELDELRGRDRELTEREQQQKHVVEAGQARLAEHRRQYAACEAQRGQLQQRLSGARERAAVLEDLEKRLEGLDAGVKEVLRLVREADGGPFSEVRGLVADLIRANVETAPLIEVALGERAEQVVVGGGAALLADLAESTSQLPGRVTFLPLDPLHETPAAAVDLEGQPGVLGRADQFVETDPRYGPLAARLLGRTWLVQRLSDALALAQRDGRGENFVTLAGQWLGADGTLAVGSRSGSAGLISRRSELRALGEKTAQLEVEIRESEERARDLEARIRQTEADVQTAVDQHEQIREACRQSRLDLSSCLQQRAHLDEQRAVIEAEGNAATAQHQTAAGALAEARSRREQIEAAVVQTESQLATAANHIERLEEDLRQRNRKATETKVLLAKSEERLANLRGRMQQFEEHQRERLRAIGEAREQLSASRRREREARWNILQAESEIADLYLRKEQLTAETVRLTNDREGVRQHRAELSGEAQRSRAAARKREEKIHSEDLRASEIRHQRDTLADRLREDYGIELAELDHEPTDEEQRRREEVQQEIDDLRRKIGNIGNVNLDALEELDELEGRHASLTEQHRDLADAKGSLEKIINKINADSRRLFSETLETVKGHFQVLFRKLFGGGRADILLDEETDILESGIEIVARPPGKEPRSISLLSGGEKTLTCVALLLAVFRSRPSPFCVLDEVDAALDEANIDRFIGVLREFLAWTQFIIVTHSKKTMTCANTIYGVTMQESGVSKQVSVRFEDVSDSGEIRPERLEATGEADREEDESQAA